MIAPPVLTTEQELPYLKLGWKLFEHLCKRLVAREEPQATGVRLYLSQGYKQHGIDGYAYDPHDRKYIRFQCKCETDFNAKKIKEAVDDFLKGELVGDSKKFILCVSAFIDGDYENELTRQRERLAEKDVVFVIWDQLELDNLLKDYPQLVYEFFDACNTPGWVKAFCGPDKVTGLRKPINPRTYTEPTAFVERMVYPVDRYDGQPESDRQPTVLTDLLIADVLAGACRIFVRSEAGMGKSTELFNAAYRLSAYNLALIFPILLHLKNYTNEDLPSWLDEQQSGWRGLDESALLLLFDGLDEVKADERENFIRKVRGFMVAHPTCHVLMSCRTNFANNQLQFDEFTTYDLRAFTKTDIEAYVNKVLSSNQVTDFLPLLEDTSLVQWLENPFSLIHFVGFFKTDPTTVPRSRAELLSRVVKLKIDEDMIRYHVLNEVDVYNQLLKRLAFVMNLLGVNSLMETDLLKLFPNAVERERCRQSALLRISNGRVSFEHNILQEYFSALVLTDLSIERLMECITFQPDHERIKPKWFNTLGILLETLPKGTTQLTDLLLFVSKQEPQLLLTIKYAHFTNELRLRAFQIMVELPERGVRHNLRYNDRLLEFANARENWQVLKYLLQQVNDEQSDNSNECLHYLAKLDKNRLFTFKSEILDVVTRELAKDNPTRQEMAVEILVNLELRADRLNALLTSDMPNLHLTQIRDDVYRYLQQTDQIETYLNFHLQGIDLYRRHRKNSGIRQVSAGWALVENLRRLRQPASLHQLLDYMIANIDYLDSSDNLFQRIINRQVGFFEVMANQLAIDYQRDSSLLDKVATLYQQMNRHNTEGFANDLSNFFALTNTQEIIFWPMIESAPNWRNDKLIGAVTNRELANECLHRYQDGQLNSRQIWSVIHGLTISKQADLSETLRIGANQVGRDSFVYTNWPDKQEQRQQNDFQLLTDQTAFLVKVNEVFDEFEAEELDSEQVFSFRQNWGDLDNDIVVELLSHFVSDEQKVARQEVIGVITNSDWWTTYLVRELLQCLENKIELPTWHIDFLKRWCYENIHNANFFNSVSTSKEGELRNTNQRGLEWTLSELYRLLDVEFPEAVLLDMLGTDFYGIYWRENDEGTPGLSAKIIAQIPDGDKLKKRVLTNLSQPITATTLLLNQFELCRRLIIREAVPYLQKAIQFNEQLDKNEQERLLTIYRELGGSLEELIFVFEEFNPADEFHWSLLRAFTEELSYTTLIGYLLLSRFESGQLKADDFRLIDGLIKAHQIEGLQLYADWVKTNGKIPQTNDRLSNLKDLPAQPAAQVLIDLAEHTLQHNIDGDRHHEPLDLFMHYILEVGLAEEETYQYVHQALSHLIEQHSTHEKNYMLRRNLAALEKEYYLQKVDYSTLHEAMVAADEYISFL